MARKNAAAISLGRKGGRVKSPAKRIAVIANLAKANLARKNLREQAALNQPLAA